jgi:GTPase SAR1 family protein
MNCCGEDEAIRTNKKINAGLRADKRRMDSIVKLLLLGAGESGKSTIAKQMKIIHLSGFNELERMAYKAIVYNNILTAMRALLNALSQFELKLQLSNQDAGGRLGQLGEEYFTGPFTKQHVSDVKDLWCDPAIQEAYRRSNEFQLSDSAAYYFNKVEEIGKDSYVPDEQDILRSRAKTTGIIETDFETRDMRFKMVDVGGQRSERKKWIHCFQDVTAVIFCVALSEYDLVLFEDDSTNRMHESLRLFQETCNLTWFKTTAMILFLNKRDLFIEKIARVPLTQCFPEYNGPANMVDPALEYIQAKFEAQNLVSGKAIYAHITTATDTENIRYVFTAVKDSVLRRALDEAGIV